MKPLPEAICLWMVANIVLSVLVFLYKKTNLDTMKWGGATYIMTNKNHTTLYVGATSDLKKRVYDHKNNRYPDSFTARYKLYKIVYYEQFLYVEDAFSREQQLKGGSRAKKIALINTFNPQWIDLYSEICSW